MSERTLPTFTEQADMGAGAAPKIRRIAISDFRAFPAIQPADIRLNGGNLLAYGENGAGKSSIYRALRGFFSVDPPDIMPLHNVFTDPPQPSVKVTLLRAYESTA